MEQHQEEIKDLREKITTLSNDALRAHMLQALKDFEEKHEEKQIPMEKDDVIYKLQAQKYIVKESKDALFLVIHYLLLESGFKLDATTQELPSNWDKNSSEGLFKAEYKHENQPIQAFQVQALFVGNKMEVYISDEQDHTHMIEINAHDYIKDTSSRHAAEVLKDIKPFRESFTTFLKNLTPKKKAESPQRDLGIRRTPQPPSSDASRDFNRESPLRIPSVGRGDIFPSFPGGIGSGGVQDPGMLVGPDHPIFGTRYDPSQGPVPGARFDPFGPPINPIGPSGFGRFPRGPRGPAPNLPFGDPNPDHMRMPRDYGNDDPPFGSGNAFF